MMKLLSQKINPFFLGCCLMIGSLLFSTNLFSQILQNTTIKGFADVLASYDKKVSFGFDEQDLFITSQLNDRFSFLGETVFKFDTTSSTDFSVSIERLV